MDRATSAVVLTVPSRIEPGFSAANTPNVQPMTMPRMAAIPARRSELAIASLRFGQTSRLPLMLVGQSPVRNPPSHVK
jgi:hypothetical protein